MRRLHRSNHQLRLYYALGLLTAADAASDTQWADDGSHRIARDVSADLRELAASILVTIPVSRLSEEDRATHARADRRARGQISTPTEPA